MSDVQDRAREALARAIPYGHGINKGITDKARGALDAAGIVLVDAQVLEQLHERCRELAETLGAERERYDRELERLCDEKRRLLAFRDTYEVWKAHQNARNYNHETDKVNRRAFNSARSDVADIESEGS